MYRFVECLWGCGGGGEEGGGVFIFLSKKWILYSKLIK